MSYSVIIVQSTLSQAEDLAEWFRAFSCRVLATCCTGIEALRLAQTMNPDAVVMSPIMPAMNCDELTERLETTCSSKIVKIALASQEYASVVARFYDHGGDLYAVAPHDFANIVRKMEKFADVRARLGTSEGLSTRIRHAARNTLLSLNVPMNIKGFFYLLDGVTLCLQTPQLLNDLVGGLYPAIAKLHNEPLRNIERCIRTAVDHTFDHGNIRNLYPIFRSSIRKSTGKPTNGAFISIVSEMVRSDLRLY